MPAGNANRKKIERRLHQPRFKAADCEGLHKLPDKNIVQIVGDTPKEEQAADQCEGLQGRRAEICVMIGAPRPNL